PADDVPTRPPLAHVRMNRIGDVDRAEPLHIRVVIDEIDLELVQPLEIEDDAAQLAVDLERVVVAAAGGESSRLEDARRAVLEPRKVARGVVDRDVAHLISGLHREAGSAGALDLDGSLVDEGVHRPDHLAELADEETGEVGDVGADVPERARAGQLLPQAPGNAQSGSASGSERVY